MILFSSNLRRTVAGLAAVAAATGAAVVHAQQQPSGPPNALQGFSQNRNQPIKINAESLHVQDKDKMATFSGDVRLLQGDVRMNSSTLVVFYDDQPPPPQPGPAPSKGGKPAATAQITPQQNQQIKRVEAKGGVTVQQKDQTATGKTGIFDMRANTVEMTGNVVITRGPNILKGDNLTVNMNTGDSTLTCGKGHEKCKVVGLFTPGSMKPEPPPAPPAAAHPAPRPRSSQSQP
jgi:lipopolysaccharide export system protein LptA